MNYGSLYEKKSRESCKPCQRQDACCSLSFAGSLCLSPADLLSHLRLELPPLLAILLLCRAQNASIVCPSAKGSSCSEGITILNRQELEEKKAEGCPVVSATGQRRSRAHSSGRSSPRRCLLGPAGSLIKPIWKIKLLNINVIWL